MKFNEVISNLKFWYYCQRYLGSVLSSFIAQEFNKYFQNKSCPLTDLSEEQKNQLAAAIFQNAFRIIGSQNPLVENRQYLADSVCEMSRFLVLIIPPAPEIDNTQMRNKPGISGELSKYAVELVERLDEFKPIYEIIKNTLSEQNENIPYVLSRCLLIQQQICSVHVTTANLLRIHLNDIARDKEDWLNQFIASVCAYTEYRYRKILNLPSVLDNRLPNVANYPDLMYPHFINLVINGSKDPYNEWIRDAKNMKLPKVE